LSGNAITEALVFGRRAGRSAAQRAGRMARAGLHPQDAAAAVDLVRADAPRRDRANTAALIAQLQAVMADDVGPFRTAEKLRRALARVAALAAELGERPPVPASGGEAGGATFDLERLEWFDLRNMLTVARTVAATALARTESRGAHQREDFPATLPQWQVHQSVRLRDGAMQISGAPATATAIAS